jgi:hypothetical protein
MTKTDAIDEARRELRGMLSRWLEETDGAPWRDALGVWVGENTHRLMAEAAVSVLAGMADMQAYMEREGLTRAE